MSQPETGGNRKKRKKSQVDKGDKDDKKRRHLNYIDQTVLDTIEDTIEEIKCILTSHSNHRSENCRTLYEKVQLKLMETQLKIIKGAESSLHALDKKAENLLSGHNLRVKVLRQVLQQGIVHRISSRKNKDTLISFPKDTTCLKSDIEVKKIVQVMVDNDTDKYNTMLKVIDSTNIASYSHSYRTKMRGVWTTAANKLLDKDIVASSGAPATEIDTKHGNNSWIVKPITEPQSTDVSTLSIPIENWDQCDNNDCKTSAPRLTECAAIGCFIKYCNNCILQVARKDLLAFYCAVCQDSVHAWFEAGENMTDDQVIAMQSEKLCMKNNSAVNIWHAYKMKVVNTLTLLPMSMSPTRVSTDKSDILQTVMKEKGDQIKLITTKELLAKRSILREQFRSLQCATGPVEYVNEPTSTIFLAKVDGHDTSSIHALNRVNSHMLQHILRHADYCSSIKIVWNKQDHSMVSVMSTSWIKRGTVNVDYGGIHFTAKQLPESSVGLCTTSSTWQVLKHKSDSTKDILLHPSLESNVGRLINGARADEQHRVNCTILHVRDEDGCVHVLVVALRDIEPGEHLFYYYGDCYLTEWSVDSIMGEFMTIKTFSEDIEWEDVPVAQC